MHHTLRTASIVALTPLELIHYTTEDIEGLVRDVPSFKHALEQAAAERVGDSEG